MNNIVKKNLVFFIDDDEIVCSTAKIFLASFFNEIIIFNSIESAENALSSHVPDVILSDYFIPGKEHGSHLSKTYKEKNPYGFFAIISGDIESISEKNNLDDIDLFIEKPITYNTLNYLFNKMENTNE